MQRNLAIDSLILWTVLSCTIFFKFCFTIIDLLSHTCILPCPESRPPVYAHCHQNNFLRTLLLKHDSRVCRDNNVLVEERYRPPRLRLFPVYYRRHYWLLSEIQLVLIIVRGSYSAIAVHLLTSLELYEAAGAERLKIKLVYLHFWWFHAGIPRWYYQDISDS